MTENEQSDIRVVEIFGPTIQGEGALIGQPTVFVRSGGCDYRCTWCDTPYAVDSEYRDDWTSMKAAAIWKKVAKLSGNQPLVVSLSGGNPAIQPLAPLIELGQKHNYRFALETQRLCFAELVFLAGCIDVESQAPVKRHGDRLRPI